MPLRTLLTSLVILAVLAPPALARSGRSSKGTTAVERATVMLLCSYPHVWGKTVPGAPMRITNYTGPTIEAGTIIYYEAKRPDNWVEPVRRRSWRLDRPLAAGEWVAINAAGDCKAWYVRRGPALQAAPIER